MIVVKNAVIVKIVNPASLDIEFSTTKPPNLILSFFEISILVVSDVV